MKSVPAARLVFGVMALLCIGGVLGPGLALASGIAFAMLLPHPYELESRKWAKRLLQWSVVALGFGMNIRDVIRTGRASLSYTAMGICLAMVVGLCLGRWLRTPGKAAFLITAGTAICGGSAIAALSPITNPSEEELAMSMGTVFTLNSVALFLFPVIGATLHLTQTQFGLWSALAIHDTSSVVGAAAKYGARALAVGTAVKLTRALWIIPVALVTAMASRQRAAVKLPLFIAFFCMAAGLNSLLPSAGALFKHVSELGHAGLALTLFLIGTGLSRQTIQRAGGRVMALGVILWFVVACVSLLAIKNGWIGLT